MINDSRDDIPLAYLDTGSKENCIIDEDLWSIDLGLHSLESYKYVY